MKGFLAVLGLAVVIAVGLPTALYALNDGFRDHGLMVAKSGRPLHWDPDDLPILVIIDPEAGEWLVPAAQAASHWNARLGFDLFVSTDHVRGEAGAFAGSGPGVVPILMHTCAPGERCVIYTDVRHTQGGRIGGAPIYVLADDLTLQQKTWILVHELGHVVGLDHDDQGETPWSIMEPRLDLRGGLKAMPPITLHDLDLIRATYAPGK